MDTDDQYNTNPACLLDQIRSNTLKPLNLVDLNKKKQIDDNKTFCILCDEIFDLIDDQKSFLAHLISSHRLVIADINQIGHLKKYVIYWKERLRTVKIDDVCFEICTNTGQKDKGDTESYYLLCDNLPEEKQLREKLNIYKLEDAIKQLELERNDQNYYRDCLFCSKLIGNNRSNLLSHMSIEHNFNIGQADNLVFFDEFYQRLKERFDRFQCLYCEKIFYDKQILKEHMRKKKHKCINPSNTEFDKFYIINYLEYSKVWTDIKHERDMDDTETNRTLEKSPSIEDWNDPAQTYFCLFCQDSYENEDEILNHMLDKHQFDFKSTVTNSNLSFYNQVKLVNYIRHQSFLNTCFVCKKKTETKEDLIKHLEENQHIKQFPDNDLWDQPEYYFSTFEDDNLLCLLDDSAYKEDESKIQVIPEQYDIKINDDVVNSLNDLSLS